MFPFLLITAGWKSEHQEEEHIPVLGVRQSLRTGGEVPLQAGRPGGDGTFPQVS